MRKSLRWQFIFPLAILFGITFSGFTFFISKTFLAIYENQLRDSLISEANLFISDFQAGYTYPPSIDDLQAETDRFADKLQARITVIQSDGVVLSDSEVDPQTMGNHSDRPEVQEALSGRTGYQVRYSATLQARLLYVAIPVYRDGQVSMVVRLARSLASIEADLADVNRAIIISGIIVLIALLGITILNFQHLMQPLQKLSKAAREIAGGNFSKVPYHRNGNEIDQVAMAFNTMSDQIKQQIETVKNEEGKLRNILMQMQDGVLIVGKTGLIRSINRAAENMFGVAGSNTIGVQLIQALQYYQLSELFESTLKTGMQNSVFIDLPQRRLYLQAIGSILEEPDGNSVLLLFQDLTKQQQVEATRKDFVSNVSHELRTPLASLRALAETLQSGAIEDAPAAHHFVELMETEISRLTQMVDELLELSRIESGKTVLKLGQVASKELIDQVVERMSMQAQRAGLVLKEQVEKNLPEINVDQEQIEQVLINLIHNAIKFTSPGGEVVVSARRMENQVIFEVKDTGTGISKEDLPRIFERFYKTDKARSSKGTGLGLSIARHVVEMHGGKIWAESEEGKGSVFKFSIPLAGFN